MHVNPSLVFDTVIEDTIFVVTEKIICNFVVVECATTDAVKCDEMSEVFGTFDHLAKILGLSSWHHPLVVLYL